MIHPSLNIPHDRLADLCRRHRIRELCVFGSATREDFSPQGDVDLLVEFEPGGEPDYFIQLPALLEELESLFGRPVDLVEGRESLINPFRRHAILRSLERLYAA